MSSKRHSPDDYEDETSDYEPRGRKKKTLRDFHREGNVKQAIYDVSDDDEFAGKR